jgi:superfamily II DNA or RNA helicase
MPGLDPSTVRDVESAILERGHLTRQEILETWGFDAEVYAALRATLLSRGRVRPGPHRGGSLAARRPRAPGAAEEPTPPILRDAWEEDAVARLCELFSHQELEALLGDLAHTVRQSRIARGEADRRGTKAELATALVVQHGIDLLADRRVRDAVGRKVGVEAPARWHPGKSAAAEFVERVSMPGELVGLAREEALPSFEYLEGRFALRPLEDFQREVSEELRLGFGTPGHRSIVTLPTGAGKTRVAVEAIRDWLLSIYDPDRRVAEGAAALWLAHTEELCEQAYACFRQVWEGSDTVAPLLLVRFWGGYTRDLVQHRATLRRILESPSVLVSTPQRMVNLLDGLHPGAASVVDDLRHALGLLVIDEAHRAAAPSYRRIMAEVLPTARRAPVVGLTATPFRMEYAEPDPQAGTRELREIFVSLVEPRRTLGDRVHATLQARGVLARPVFETIATNAPMRMPPLEDPAAPTQDDLERIDRALAVRADSSRRRLAILDRLVPIAQDPRSLVLYFGPSVRDAECMAFLLRERQVPAAVVSGTTREATRRHVVERFKRGELRVLCNCEVLTTGFDAPRVTHIVMARPTVSQVLYEQMVGRGLRGPRFGGTETCVILDCEDHFAGPVRPELGYQRFRRVWSGA